MSPLKKNVILLSLFWTALLTASLAWNIYEQRQGVVANSYIQATVAIEKDISFRSWATSHGGVYVKPTEKSPPNPYLTVPDRDVVTTNGIKLTLINPAYMMRQLYQRASPKDAIKGHITSLKLLNPGNVPDEWEREALQAFERGEKERTAVVTTADGKDKFRYMRPFYVEPGCLKCHGNMGYKVGDIRGGISTTVDMGQLEAASAAAARGIKITHGLVWLVGLIGIGMSGRRFKQRAIERERGIEEIRRNEQRALAMLTLDNRAEELDEKTLLQKGLEVAERLTSSRISYLHFINDDQQTIELYTWSKHTLEKCEALFDKHYPLAAAGMWADCVRTRQPAVHNDYQALDNKHGYPEGHVHLVRHLSVPVLEGDKVRLILGVGNKENEYDEADTRLLQMIANDLWNTARRQRSEKAMKTYAAELENANKELEAEIGQRAAVQSALQESEARFRAITSHNPDHLLMQDSELRYTFVMNPQLGLTEQDMLGKTDFDFLAHDDAEKLMALKRKVLVTGKSEYVEMPLTAKGGQMEFFEGAYIPKFDAGGKVDGLIGYFRNVTQRKRSEDQIQHLNDELQQRAAALETANKELEAFSYSISHDLRSPLRAIDGFSRILLEDYADKLDAEGRRILDVVRDNAIQMGRLIDDILKFSRTGRAELTSTEIDMEALARTVLDELALSVDTSRVRAEIGPLPHADGDPALLHQVFANLLSNAIKYSSKNPAPLVKVGASSDGNETVYYVSDNGVGFDMQYAGQLFGVFQRLHTVNEFEGTGIGLAIVKRIITRHGGRVWAEGKVNEGATVYFTLPTKGEKT